MSKLDGEDVGLIALAALFVGVVVVFAWMAIAAIRADGKPDYCYADTNPQVPGVRLMQHRPWRPDEPVQVCRDATELAAAAKAIGCPLR